MTYDEWKTAAPPDAAPEEQTLAQWVAAWDSDHVEQACGDYLDDCVKDAEYTRLRCKLLDEKGFLHNTTFVHAFAHWLSLFPDRYTPRNVLDSMNYSGDRYDSFCEFIQGCCEKEFKAFLVTEEPEWLESWYEDDMELAREEQA